MSEGETMSANTSERVVLDSYAVLALLEGETKAEAVEDVLHQRSAWMTLVNLGEVTYILERERGRAAADHVFANLLAEAGRGEYGPISWLPVNERLVREAASLKSRGGISYADCFAAAAAYLLDCPVLTGDPEFAVAEAAGIQVKWL
jgi:PIN domain nuclease of toxin-antitoxin system